MVVLSGQTSIVSRNILRIHIIEEPASPSVDVDDLGCDVAGERMGQLISVTRWNSAMRETHLLSSDARKTATVATSTGWPGRPIGGDDMPMMLDLLKVEVTRGV